MLKEEEAIVIQTREKQEGYISLSERVRIANEADSDLFISIHQNTHKDKNVSGTETFYYPVIGQVKDLPNVYKKAF